MQLQIMKSDVTKYGYLRIGGEIKQGCRDRTMVVVVGSGATTTMSAWMTKLGLIELIWGCWRLWASPFLSGERRANDKEKTKTRTSTFKLLGPPIFLGFVAPNNLNFPTSCPRLLLLAPSQFSDVLLCLFLFLLPRKFSALWNFLSFLTDSSLSNTLLQVIRERWAENKIYQRWGFSIITFGILIREMKSATRWPRPWIEGWMTGKLAFSFAIWITWSFFVIVVHLVAFRDDWHWNWGWGWTFLTPFVDTVFLNSPSRRVQDPDSC